MTEFLRKQEETGQTISGRLRSLPGYRNPDFLQHCVVYDNISEFGSCYPPDIFDPTNLPIDDYFDRYRLARLDRQATLLPSRPPASLCS